MRLLDRIKMMGAALLFGVAAWIAIYYTNKSVTPPAVVEQVEVQYYARIAAIYEGNIDWRFFVSQKILSSMAPQFIGKPMLLAHDWRNPNVCVGRVVDAAVKEDKYGKYVEVIVLINNEETADMIRRDAYHGVSIGFETLKEVCLIDGKDPEECGHQPGHQYKIAGKTVIARSVLVEVRIHEVSFVNVPASPNARVLELANHPLRCSDSK